MSNATQNSRNSGDSRRRRSRGGQNRRNNENHSERRSNEGRNNEGRQSDGRQSGGGKRESVVRTGGRQDTGKPQRRPMPAPVQLSWWQKLLKAIGLYKEPVRPPRPERRPDAVEPAKTREPRRSQTRDARTSSTDPEAQPSGEAKSRGNRRERGERGEREGNRRGGNPATVENRRVYVGNLSYEVTESDLEELFKGVGAVRRIEIVYNRNTHRSKGYAFVEMLDIDEAKRTVEVLHDQFFMGRKLTVSGAKSQEHEAAEKEEGASERTVNVMPVLAPLPPKEQVLDLVSEPKAEEPVAESIAEEPHAEIPTEEFHDVAESTETKTEEEAKDQANA